MATADAPECLTCGTCCFSTLERYVPVTGDDYARLGDAADTHVTWLENRAYLRMEGGRCAALLLDPGAGRFVCAIYARRPEVCRELARGSPQCHGEIATKGERPLLALRGLLGGRGGEGPEGAAAPAGGEQRGVGASRARPRCEE